MTDKYIKVTNTLIAKNNVVGSKYWTLLEDENFFKICRDSFVRPPWDSFEGVINSDFKNKMLKPINGYAINFYPKPELKIFDDYISLTQKTHAEIWVHNQTFGLYAVDKCMQRQFYPSSNPIDLDKEKVFSALYKFYIPWFIDEDVFVEINNISTAFCVYTKNIKFKKCFNNKNDADWVDFAFLKLNRDILDYGDKNVLDSKYGIIKRQTPMYEIIIKDLDVAKRIIAEYDK